MNHSHSNQPTEHKQRPPKAGQGRVDSLHPPIHPSTQSPPPSLSTAQRRTKTKTKQQTRMIKNEGGRTQQQHKRQSRSHSLTRKTHTQPGRRLNSSRVMIKKNKISPFHFLPGYDMKTARETQKKNEEERITRGRASDRQAGG